MSKVEAVRPDGQGIENVVGDKGYHIFLAISETWGNTVRMSSTSIVRSSSTELSISVERCRSTAASRTLS